MLFEIALVARCSLDMSPAYLELQIGRGHKARNMDFMGRLVGFEPSHLSCPLYLSNLRTRQTQQT
jgi:hypothetical protein